jgi:hypothetical protein
MLRYGSLCRRCEAKIGAHCSSNFDIRETCSAVLHVRQQLCNCLCDVSLVFREFHFNEEILLDFTWTSLNDDVRELGAYWAMRRMWRAVIPPKTIAIPTALSQVIRSPSNKTLGPP